MYDGLFFAEGYLQNPCNGDEVDHLREDGDDGGGDSDGGCTSGDDNEGDNDDGDKTVPYVITFDLIRSS